MATFPNNNEVDIRIQSKPKKRSVNYKLPEIIENKLSNLMNELQLDTGTIDIIKSVNGDFYFLEVNPVGQFGDVSNECNYHLEKIIAEDLLSYGNDKGRN